MTVVSCGFEMSPTAPLVAVEHAAGLEVVLVVVPVEEVVVVVVVKLQSQVTEVSVALWTCRVRSCRPT